MSYASEQAILNAQYNAAYMAQLAEQARVRPSVLYRPTVSLDGNQWCALYGANVMEGVCGFGDSPEDAMTDFDNNWRKKISP